MTNKQLLPNVDLINKLTSSWCPEDLQNVRPDLSLELCTEILEDNTKWFMEQLIEHGYFLLETLAGSYPREEKE
jgi:hypothetical protein